MIFYSWKKYDVSPLVLTFRKIEDQNSFRSCLRWYYYELYGSLKLQIVLSS